MPGLRGQLRQPQSNARERRNVANLSNFPQWLDPDEPILLNDLGVLTIRTGDGIVVSSGDLTVQTQDVVGLDSNGLLLNYTRGLQNDGSNNLEVDAGAGLFFASGELQVNPGNGLLIAGGALVADLGDGLAFVGTSIEPDLAVAGGLEIVGGELAVDESNVDHNALANFVVDEHVDHSSVSILTNEGLTGGGDLTANRTINLDFPGLSQASDVDGDNDLVAVYDQSAGAHRWINPGSLKSGGREQLEADRTYYVDPTNGSDSNDGLTSGNAFATVQKAVDVAASLDFSIYDVTIQLAADTYNEQGIVLKSYVGAGKVIINGDTTTYSNVTFSATSSVFTGRFQGIYTVQGMKITTTGGVAIQQLRAGGTLEYADIEFGDTAFAHIFAGEAGRVVAVGDYTISGGSGRHIRVDQGSTFRQAEGNVNINNTPDFPAEFIEVGETSFAFVNSNNVVFNGSATGPRYDVNANGALNTNGGGANFFPGNQAGITSTGGVYL